MVQSIKTQRSGSLRGVALLDDPMRNKGTAFTSEERRQCGLEGYCRMRWKALTGRSSA